MNVSSVGGAAHGTEAQAKAAAPQQQPPPPSESDSVDIFKDAQTLFASSVLDT